jgi:hypothetical protein
MLRRPPAELDFLPAPCLVDSLVILSADGREQDRISLLEAFRASPFALILDQSNEYPTTQDLLTRPELMPGPDAQARLKGKGDFMHANSVQVLSRSRAAKFPLFKPGQLLLSFRSLDALAVLDPSTRCIVWAARGVWRVQHDAEFLDNGHLLLFDNAGSLKGCRVIEYDPVTQAMPWVYASERFAPFRALFRGMKQRLPNGNTLIVDPDNARLVEVTRDKDTVWEYLCSRTVAAVASACRYRPEQLTFLKRGAHARPE